MAALIHGTMLVALTRPRHGWVDCCRREIDLACRGWGDALDALLGPYNCVMSWKGELGQMTPEELMNKFGVKSLLFGIMLLGKLCRYAVQGGIDLRVSASELACKLAAACFKCSFTHPQVTAKPAAAPLHHALVPVAVCLCN